VISVIQALQDFMYPIKSMRRNGGYMLLSHLLTKAELEGICTCIQAAPFVNQKDSNELIDKLLGTGSKYHRQAYCRHVFHKNNRKVENVQVMRSIETLYSAIENGYKVSFDYMHYAEDMKLHIVNKKPIIVEPREITFKEEQPYLLATGGKYPGIMTYRIDKILNVKILDKKVSFMNQDKDAIDLANERLFMYGGKQMYVTFRFKQSMLDKIIDAYGHDFMLIQDGDEHYLCTVKTSDNAAIIFAQKFLDAVEIENPESLKVVMRNTIRNALSRYL
jgi:predicted DNA-binding transcriptional regulator YafY